MITVNNASQPGHEYSSSCGSPRSVDGGTPSPDHDMRSAMAESDAKRRKLRKGTHSCWECKRRKIRCTFAAANHDACIGCRRRGTTCLSQEFPETAEEEVSSPPTAACSRRIGQMGERIVRVETLIEELSRKISQQLKETGRGVPTPAPSTCDASSMYHIGHSPESIAIDGEDFDARPGPSTQHRDPESQVLLRFESSGHGTHDNLSKALHAVMPTPEDAEIVSEPGNNFFIQAYRQAFTRPHSYVLSQDGKAHSDFLAHVPSSDQHPVVLARYMFSFALQLQVLSGQADNKSRRLSMDPGIMMARLSDTAIALVTSNDALIDTVEGLECVLLQGLFETVGGNLRRAWVTFRRAMVAAQLMGIQRSLCPPLKVVDRNTKVDPHTMWLRIVYHDRWISLLLGLPQGCLDTSMASDARLAADTPTGRLERHHTALAGCILARNEKVQLGPEDWVATQGINADLHRASNVMPDKWWLIPNLSNLSPGSPESYRELTRMMSQLTHFNLVNTLHLPYMLRFPADGQSDYCKIMCVNASREILSRFIVYRTSNRNAVDCQPVFLSALTASMTLLLAYIDSHKLSGGSDDNIFAHQRMGDRGIIAQVLESMERTSREDKTSLCQKTATIMRRLMLIEEEAAKHGHYSTQSMLGSDIENDLPNENTVLRINIPFFGIVKIAKDDIDPGLDAEKGRSDWALRTAEVPTEREKSPTFVDRNEKPSCTAPPGPPPLRQHTFATLPNPPFPVCPSLERVPDMHQRVDPQPPHSTLRASIGSQEQPYHFEPHFVPEISQALQQHYHYPAVTTRPEEWEFQGVDVAFFENLTRGAQGPTGVGGNKSGGARHGAWSN